jgi:uncharacterized RDD family membrane protein YckC
MERKAKRTIISIEDHQPEFDFEEAGLSLPFTFPEYQKKILVERILAGATDFGIVALFYSIFLLTTFLEMPSEATLDRRILGIYGAGYFVLVAIYFLLFMLSASQTPGMKTKHLHVVTKEGLPLDPGQACMRGMGYLIAILPIMLGFIWALIDPEHLTWTDKVSGTYIKKL